MEIKHFFDRLWDEYIKITPQAKVIYDHFEKKYGKVINDHVAFRTYNLTPISIGELEPHLLNLGYVFNHEYEFEEKKLYARSYVHSDDQWPMIFLSQLLVEQLSLKAQEIIHGLVGQMSEDSVLDWTFFYSGLWWSVPTSLEYNLLLKESEYAAWLSVMGMRANHFTVRVPSLKEALEDVKKLNFKINTSGGEIKGSSQLLLEQGSTMADHMNVKFSDGIAEKIPTCYYEFAQRYYDESGKLYKGFVTSSADKIFESTNRGK